MENVPKRDSQKKAIADEVKKAFEGNSPLKVAWISFSIFTGVMSMATIAQSIVIWKGFMENLLILYTSLFYWLPEVFFYLFGLNMPQ